MKKINKIIAFYILSVLMISILKPTITKANSNPIINYTANQLVEIADPYIVETFISYSIKDKDELISKIGLENFKALEKRLSVANKEKQALLSRDAVNDFHVAILRSVDAEVEYHWWGKRIKTSSYTEARHVRNLAHAFAGKAGKDGLKLALATAGISFVPGLGSLATITGIFTTLFTWADAETWSRVNNEISNKMDKGQYNLTIDINGWIMDVKVY